MKRVHPENTTFKNFFKRNLRKMKNMHKKFFEKKQLLKINNMKAEIF